jgi:hypothetical protein
VRAYLAHERWNDAVKRRASVAKSLLASAESAEVLGGFGSDVGSQFHGDTTNIFTSNFHIEIDYFWQ